MPLLSVMYRFSFWHIHGALSAETRTHSLLDLNKQWLEDDVGCRGERKVDCLSSVQDGPADYTGRNSIFIMSLIVQLLISIL